MTGIVTWEVLSLLALAVMTVSGLVGGMLLWMHNQVREVDKALSALDKAFALNLTNNRHDMRAELQREVAKTDLDLEARRKEIQDIAHRVTRLEARLNGNHPAK